MESNALFCPGQLVHHKKFDYRGVIIDVDARFEGRDEWYEQVARSRPPKDKPWYHVLVDQTATLAYVAERHLEPDHLGTPIHHPNIKTFFRDFKNGTYIAHSPMN